MIRRPVLATVASSAALAVTLAAVSAGFSPAGAAQAAGPSFDCKNAHEDIEQMVCKDDTLAQLDRETTRLYGLALDSRSLPTAQKKMLLAGQRGWLRGRNDCAKADDARLCTANSYLERIYELRHTYAGARTQDNKGISRGPFNIRCPGEAVIAGTFVQTDPGYAYLRWLDQRLVLRQTPAASGARYAATVNESEALFWDKGPDAQVTLPGKAEASCRVEVTSY